MHVSVGFSDNPDTTLAGTQAAQNALRQSGRDGACDFVLLFSTARHDAKLLRDAVASVFGPSVRITGGAAVGAITNDRFGYSGDQVGLAAFWQQKTRCTTLAESGLTGDEEEVGRGLAQRLADAGITRQSPAVLLYDAVDRTQGGMRLIMATPLLAGIEKELGFLPECLVGAGLMGDYACSPTKQWVNSDVVQHHAIALTFSGDVRIDNVIMHGCRPATGYYTVTKAAQQAILEINGQPALKFIDSLLGDSIAPEQYPFILIFGINNGDKWEDFDEKNYASRLCLAIDKEHDAIIMFEPDMIEGTQFQIMYRTFDLSYMKPEIEKTFANLRGRKPVFAFYINCAGRAAGRAGVDQEDAVMLQDIVANRVPLLGIYSGVEIASVMGCPRALDWTGVFCLFSVTG
jgi:hypothetical protein